MQSYFTNPCQIGPHLPTYLPTDLLLTTYQHIALPSTCMSMYLLAHPYSPYSLHIHLPTHLPYPLVTDLLLCQRATYPNHPLPALPLAFGPAPARHLTPRQQQGPMCRVCVSVGAKSVSWVGVVVVVDFLGRVRGLEHYECVCKE